MKQPSEEGFKNMAGCIQKGFPHFPMKNWMGLCETSNMIFLRVVTGWYLEFYVQGDFESRALCHGVPEKD